MSEVTILEDQPYVGLDEIDAGEHWKFRAWTLLIYL